jgi:hypothetical protein
MSQTNKMITAWQRIFLVVFVLVAVNSDEYLNNHHLVTAQPVKPIPTKQLINRRTTHRKPWLIERILEFLQPRKRSGGSRGDTCLKSPVFKPDRPLLWTRQPRLVWIWIRHDESKSKLVRVTDISSKRVILEKEVNPNLQQLYLYQLRIDQPLEFGKRYVWEIVADPRNEVNNPKVEFQVVDKAQWQKIDRDFETLNRQLASQQLDSEHITLERVKYFAQLQMWGDVTEVIYSLPDEAGKSEKIIDLKTKIANELGKCVDL